MESTELEANVDLKVAAHYTCPMFDVEVLCWQSMLVCFGCVGVCFDIFWWHTNKRGIDIVKSWSNQRADDNFSASLMKVWRMWQRAFTWKKHALLMLDKYLSRERLQSSVTPSNLTWVERETWLLAMLIIIIIIIIIINEHLTCTMSIW